MGVRDIRHGVRQFSQDSRGFRHDPRKPPAVSAVRRAMEPSALRRAFSPAKSLQPRKEPAAQRREDVSGPSQGSGVAHQNPRISVGRSDTVDQK